METKVTKSDEEWRSELTPEQYEVLRRQGTEPPFSGKYTYSKEDGVYRCAACGNELFSSDTKFDSGTGWPSFYEPAAAELDVRQRLPHAGKALMQERHAEATYLPRPAPVTPS